ncbi:hypothetical protein BGX34_008855 [Mortierella sp. NVP85]|nr:hypothetical protein BGX34_008855 [Mortierella sp. NVP85]
MRQHTLPPPSGENSDSEDHHRDSDTPHPPSETVPLLFEREDRTQPSPSPTAPLPVQSMGTDGGSDDEDDAGTDDERNLLTFSLYEDEAEDDDDEGGQDDFHLVGPSDLESISRSHSSLSTHSDHVDQDNPMKFIYPSLPMVHSVDSTTHNDSDPHGHTNKASLDGEAKMYTAQGESPSETPHQSTPHQSTHVQPDSEKRSTSDGADPSRQNLTADTAPVSGTAAPVPELHLPEDKPEDELEDRPEVKPEVKPEGIPESIPEVIPEGIPGGIPEDKAIDQVNSCGSKLEGSSDPVLDHVVPKAPESTASKSSDEHVPPECPSSASNPDTLSSSSSAVALKTLFDSLPSDSPAEKFFASKIGKIGTFGVLLLLLLGLSVEYYHRSLPPAHVVVSQIGYSDGYRLAYVELRVFTHRFRQQVSQTPGFHVRVLNDNKPWRLEEAPRLSPPRFSEPSIYCKDGRCSFDIWANTMETHRGQSPWLCSDTSYYLHIWFANGTRVSDTPPEIFTSREGQRSKPPECSRKTPGVVMEESFHHLYLHARQTMDLILKRCPGLETWDLCWTEPSSATKLGTAVKEIERLLRQVPQFSEHCAALLIKPMQQLMEEFRRAEETIQGLSGGILMRAQENAKKITGMPPDEVREYIQELVEEALGQLRSNMESLDQAWPYTLLKDGQRRFSASKLLSKADQMISKAEKNLDSWIRSGGVQKTMKSVPVEKIARQADRIALGTETQLKKATGSLFGLLRQGIEEAKASSAGKQLAREVDAVKEDAERRLKDFLKKFAV